MSDLQAFRSELVALLPRLRRFARSLTGHPADADDLVQLAVERALLHWRQWRPGTRLDAWMFGVLRNAWIDELRGRQRRAKVFVPEELGETVGDASDEQQQTALAINQALAALSVEHREVVALVLVEGFSYDEAAQLLEIPVGTLTSRLSRAREALAEAMK